MAMADAMPVLPEHDITVVNTFVQVSEARPRHRLQRSQTAPVTAADDEALSRQRSRQVKHNLSQRMLSRRQRKK